MMFRRLFYVLIGSVLLYGIAGCGASTEPVSSTGDTKIELTLGPSTDLVSGSIPKTGGSLVVKDSSAGLKGLTFTAPKNAFSTSSQIQISSQPVQKHNLGSDFSPVSPMITVRNGGGYSDSAVYIYIPIKTAASEFAMAFAVDPVSGNIEGLPTVESDSTHVIVALTNFEFSRSANPLPMGAARVVPTDDASTSIVVSKIKESELSGDYRSGFQPGVDDFEFINEGSTITAGGNCAGQSLAAMYYYKYQKQVGGPLYGKFDNNNPIGKTPQIWCDDTLGYRWATMTQKDKNWVSVGNIARSLIQIFPLLSDVITWKSFAYAIKLTGRPQLAIISSRFLGAEHALVVYRVNNRTLYVADPNMPGNQERKITFANLFFNPYSSGERADQNAFDYTHIFYLASSGLINWHSYASRYAEVQARTIGNDAFPDVTLTALDTNVEFTRLVDGFVTSPNMALSATNGMHVAEVYDRSQNLYAVVEGQVTLKPGKQWIGCLIADGKDNWVGFRWYNIKVTGTDSNAIWPLGAGTQWYYKSTAFDSNGVATKSLIDTMNCDTLPAASLAALKQQLPYTAGHMWYRITLTSDPNSPSLISPRPDGIYNIVDVRSWKYPTSIGDTFQTQNSDIDGRTTIGGLQTVATDVSVSVPAGTFKCLKFDLFDRFVDNGSPVPDTDRVQNSLYGTCDVQIFRAPGIGQIQDIYYTMNKRNQRYIFLRRELIGYRLTPAN